MYDLDLVERVYEGIAAKVGAARRMLGRPMTCVEKTLYAHLWDGPSSEAKRGEDYVNFAPDRVAMQDATAQMALLQFMNAGRNATAVPATVHADHLIVAENGAATDLPRALDTNREVYDFLRTVANKYGMGFWRPGAGIIHQIVLENYAFPGGMMIGTDSHTPTAGGLGMVAVGVGGADAVDVMAGMAWELRMPKIIGVRLTGRLTGWASPKDVILKLTGILTVKGGTNAVIEYFGPGAATLSATGKATICNMGAEVGATCSLFPYDEAMADYLRATGREEVARLASAAAAELRADAEVEAAPESFFDRVIEIDLSEVEPYVNGPFTPDAAWPLSQFAGALEREGFPRALEVALIGSCTNSSYEDLAAAAAVAREAKAKGLKPRAQLLINPGSAQVLETAVRDGLIADLEAVGGVVMANACGPCIGQWNRNAADNDRPNSIATTFNRNFAKRADGNPNTNIFIVSPQIAVALAMAGDMGFDPARDTLDGVHLSAPQVDALPARGMTVGDSGYVAPVADGSAVEVSIDPASQRIQLLKPFPPFDPAGFVDMRLLLKVSGKCTTDHISMAGKWLRFRGHLDNISDNLLMGAVNCHGGNTNDVLNQLTGERGTVSAVARYYKSHNLGSIVVAEENYGEGSSREHAALEPRFLNVRAVLAKSFARIHETNLKKQGVLAITFADKADYDRIGEFDTLTIVSPESIASGRALETVVRHPDGTTETILAHHTYNELQIRWLKAGSALNCKQEPPRGANP
ncbi:MAG: aconitate hydratase [Rikenellaceae bacterium]|nr:aconitate hydratase [Rikenellaceae bacterium]